MENIILIGMPGVGKSTIGVVLAKALGYQFIDTDLIIQEKEGRLLKDIIEQEGIHGFIELENRINCKISAVRSVIAPGGSVIYGREAMEHFQKIGTVIYLKISYQELLNRLGSLKDRGVVLKEGQDLRALYEERVPLYEKYAHITVSEDHLNIEDTVHTILQILNH